MSFGHTCVEFKVLQVCTRLEIGVHFEVHVDQPNAVLRSSKARKACSEVCMTAQRVTPHTHQGQSMPEY